MVIEREAYIVHDMAVKRSQALTRRSRTTLAMTSSSSSVGQIIHSVDPPANLAAGHH
jgi:hypothetical protein